MLLRELDVVDGLLARAGDDDAVIRNLLERVLSHVGPRRFEELSSEVLKKSIPDASQGPKPKI